MTTQDLLDFERYWKTDAELHADECGSDVKMFAEKVWLAASPKNDISFDFFWTFGSDHAYKKCNNSIKKLAKIVWLASREKHQLKFAEIFSVRNCNES